MISTKVAGMMVDKIVARGLIYGRLNSVEREARIHDYQQTYALYDERIVFEVFVDWLNSHHGAPQPVDLIPRIKKIQNERRDPQSGLVYMTPEQVAECRALCKAAGCNARAFLDIVDDIGHDTEPVRLPMIRGSYEQFSKRLVRALAEGRIN